MGANEQMSLSGKTMVIVDEVEAICKCSNYLFPQQHFMVIGALDSSTRTTTNTNFFS